MLKRHFLRTGDALKMGAAMVASAFEPETVHFLSETCASKPPLHG
jgi:hypothetical protein